VILSGGRTLAMASIRTTANSFVPRNFPTAALPKAASSASNRTRERAFEASYAVLTGGTFIKETGRAQMVHFFALEMRYWF
jgi:hypothetical protein